MLTLMLVKHPQAVQETLKPGEALPPDERNGLTSDGREAAKAVAEAIAGEDGDVRVYSSPLRRCAEAAGIIAQRVSTKVQSVDDLADRDMGAESREGEGMERFRAARDHD